VYFGLYYVLFNYGILRFNLATPGREAAARTKGDARIVTEPVSRAAGMVAALGGSANLTAVDACTTRLRLSVADSARIDVAALTRLGAMGVVRPGPNAVQVVLGPIADQVAAEIRRYVRSGAGNESDGHSAKAVSICAPELLAALGGVGNVDTVDCANERILVTVLNNQRIDRLALGRLTSRGIAITKSGLVHVLLGPEAPRNCKALRNLLK
jgi:PTS system N-acetylglucosamine-specific IIC component